MSQYLRLQAADLSRARLVPDQASGKMISLSVFPGDTVARKNRAEIVHISENGPGTTIIYEWSFMIPEDFVESDSDKLWQIIGQWHSRPDTTLGQNKNNFSARPPISLKLVYEGTQCFLVINYGVGRKRNIGKSKIHPGEWNHLKFTIHWSETNEGWLEAWHNAKQINVSNRAYSSKYFGANMVNGVPNLFKIGLYRSWGWKSANTIYIDNLTKTKVTY